VGEIKVVCPCIATKENNVTNTATNENQVRFAPLHVVSSCLQEPVAPEKLQATTES
jgi:hypothetical protein